MKEREEDGMDVGLRRAIEEIKDVEESERRRKFKRQKRGRREEAVRAVLVSLTGKQAGDLLLELAVDKVMDIFRD